MASKVQIVCGCGYHPSHLETQDSPFYIPAPSEVKHVELGLAELVHNKNNRIYPHADLSLHLARSPICEDEQTQNDFSLFLKSKISENTNQVSSLGLHLTGPRQEGIGKLGFSSHFTSTDDLESRAIYFVNKLKSDLNLPVWLENANFYSSSAQEVIQNWASVSRILKSTGAGLIFDLTHCYIESHNLGLNPEFIFALVPWNHVVEIHISGYVTGGDGALHDGHSQPVTQEMWNFLKFVLERFIVTESVIVNIEHTDLSWKNKKEEYQNQFSQLNSLQHSKIRSSVFHDKQINYAVSNIHRIVSLRHPEIQNLLEENGFDQRKVIATWINEFMQSDLRLVFSKQEVPAAEDKATVAVIDGFMDYIRKNLA